jgi:hypothetical protein
MQISQLKDKEKIDKIEVRIIWLKDGAEQKFGKTIQLAIVADANLEKGPTAYLDLYNENCNKFKKGDKILITDAWCKLMNNGSGQFWITNTTKVELI